MKRLALILLLCAFASVTAQDPVTADSPFDWVVWLDGTHYAPDWALALEAVLDAMKPGETGLLVAPELRYEFVRENGGEQLASLIKIVRPSMEQGGNRYTQLLNEMIAQGARISAEESSTGDIKAYLLSRKQLLTLYAQGHKQFWASLSSGLLASRTRLVVLVQQVDVPAVSREILEALRENPRMREWVLDLQEAAPYEEKSKGIRAAADMIKAQKSRVDGFYIKAIERGFRGTEVSRAFFSGVTRLCKAGGGVGENLNRKPQETAALLMK